METISLKMDETLLKDIDRSLIQHRYSTRTEFIRDAIRTKLTDLEKEDAIKKLYELKGKFKSDKTDEEVGEIAFKKIADKLGVELD